jgi:peroxiredoxin
MIELGQLEKQHEEFARRHTRIVAVSVDNLEDSQKTKQNVPHLNVVADTDHKLTDAAAVMYKDVMVGEEVAAPTTILVDKHGVVRSLYRSKNVGSRLSPDELLAMVDKELPENK